MTKRIVEKEWNIVLCGEAGQGLQTIDHALTRLLKDDGYYTFSTSEFMSRIRGGVNATTIRVSGTPVHHYAETIDILIALSPDAVRHVAARRNAETILIGEPSLRDVDPSAQAVDFAALAAEAGNKRYANTVAAGFLAHLFGVSPDLVRTYLETRFAPLGRDVVEGNLQAARAGAQAAEPLRERVEIRIPRAGAEASRCHMITGAEAVALGAIGGGCDFVSSYPMSPSTGVLVALARYAQAAGVLVEQAEDEIAAINMALGAWYAGGRALVTTSGGGFALMCEGLSLAGMTETPIVVHLGQRPGPATGLPTRTEQGDLDLALDAGHGEFPRILYAPGSPEQACRLACRAFQKADQFQIPVILLTDQYLLDSQFQMPRFPPDTLRAEHHIVETRESYRRYFLTESGISPRGIPGYGKGLVAVDSDEHTEEGYITESMAVRKAMVNKRLAKLPALRDGCEPPEWIGPPDADHLVVCWGSNYYPVQGALERIARPDMAMLHFSQVYPLSCETAGLLRRARHRHVVENNATGQFARLLQRETGCACASNILSYDGLPFAVEHLATELKKRSVS